MAIALIAACTTDPKVEPDAGADLCRADFGICHADVGGACFITRNRTDDGSTETCAVSFDACEPMRAMAMRDAGCNPAT